MIHSKQPSYNMHKLLLFACCFISMSLCAQSFTVINPEVAICQVSLATKVPESIKASTKKSSKPKMIMTTHKLAINQMGYFNQVYNVQPNQKVLVELTYPNAKAGDKVLAVAVDGGFFEKKAKINVVQLNNFKKIAFNFFTVEDVGIYKIMLKKGNDMKFVQLWVGPEPTPTSK